MYNFAINLFIDLRQKMFWLGFNDLLLTFFLVRTEGVDLILMIFIFDFYLRLS